MTDDQFLNIIEKRLANKLSILNVGDDKHKEKLTLALEVHRLLPHCPLVKLRYVFRMVHLKLVGVVPDKARTHAFLQFYQLLEVAMGDHQWPDPKIPNNKHDGIRMKLQESNGYIAAALNGDDLTATQNRIVVLAAADETKLAIKAAAEKRKREAAKAKQEAKLSDDKRRAIARREKAQAKQDEKEIQLIISREIAKAEEEKKKAAAPTIKPIKKIKNGGHKPSRLGETEVRQAAWATLDEKVHEIYRQRHHRDTDRIPMEEYREIAAIIHVDTEMRRRMEERKYAAELMAERSELPYCVSHKIRLMPNNKQKQYLQQCFGIARFCYNWCIDEWMRLREQGERPYGSAVSAKLNEIAKKEFPFIYKVTHFAKQTGLSAFEIAVNNFFKGSGFPQRKKRGIGCGSLHYVVTGKRKDPILADFNPDVPNSQPSAKRQYLLIPTFGYVKMAEKLRFNGQLTSVRIKLQADGHYYAVLNVYIDEDEWQRTHSGKYKTPMRYGVTIDTPTGIDLGVKDLAILSNGVKISRREEDERLRQKKKELQKRISHQHECHPNRTTKRQMRNKWQLAKVNAKIGRQRFDYLHKATTALAYIYRNVSMENLNVMEMMKDGDHMASKLLNACFYNFRILMEQKMMMNDHHLHVADKYLPTTRTCSVCGCVGDPVPLEERTFRCKECGAEIDRDVNAAINLAKLIGLDEPNPSPADKGAITAALQACGVMVHQAGEENR